MRREWEEGSQLIFEPTGAGAKASAPFASSRCSRARGTAAASAAFKHFPKENLGEAGLCMADRNKIGIPAGPVPCGAEEAGELRRGDRLHGEGQRLIFELTGAGAKASAPFASAPLRTKGELTNYGTAVKWEPEGPGPEKRREHCEKDHFLFYGNGIDFLSEHPRTGGRWV